MNPIHVYSTKNERGFGLVVVLRAVLAVLRFSDCAGEVAGLDFGSNNLVVGVIGGNLNLELLQSESGNRVSPALASIDGIRRYYANDAYNKQIRLNNRTFSNIIGTIGRTKPSNTDYLLYPTARFQVDSESIRPTFFDFSLNESITPEEIIAIILDSVASSASRAADKGIPDYVISIPSTFTQSQRLALLDGAKAARISIISLIESNIASALWFGQERSRTLPLVDSPWYKNLQAARKEAEEERLEALKREKREKSLLTKVSRFVKKLLGTKESPKTSTKKWKKFVTKDPASLALLSKDIRPVIFADIGGSQSTYSLVQFEFDIINNTKGLNRRDNDTEGHTRTNGLLDVHLVHSSNLGGTNFTAPLTIELASGLCSVIKDKHGSITPLDQTTKDAILSKIFVNSSDPTQVEEIEKQYGPFCKEVYENPVILLKIHRQAQHGKEMLSVAPSLNVVIEDPYRGIDEYKHILTRESYEKRIAPFISELQKTTLEFKALVQEHFPKLDLTEVPIELLGGTSRIPLVENMIQQSFGKSGIGKRLNLDESAAYGATLMGHLQERRYAENTLESNRWSMRREDTRHPTRDEEADNEEVLKKKRKEWELISTESMRTASKTLLPPGELEGTTQLGLRRRAQYDITADVRLAYNVVSKNASTQTCFKRNEEGRKECEYVLEGSIPLIKKGMPHTTSPQLVVPLNSLSLIWHPIEADQKAKMIDIDDKKRVREELDAWKFGGGDLGTVNQATYPDQLPDLIEITIRYSDPSVLPANTPDLIYHTTIRNVEEQVRKELQRSNKNSTGSYEDWKEDVKGRMERGSLLNHYFLGNAAFVSSYKFDTHGILSNIKTGITFGNSTAFYPKPVQKEETPVEPIVEEIVEEPEKEEVQKEEVVEETEEKKAEEKKTEDETETKTDNDAASQPEDEQSEAERKAAEEKKAKKEAQKKKSAEEKLRRAEIAKKRKEVEHRERIEYITSIYRSELKRQSNTLPIFLVPHNPSPDPYRTQKVAAPDTPLDLEQPFHRITPCPNTTMNSYFVEDFVLEWNDTEINTLKAIYGPIITNGSDEFSEHYGQYAARPATRFFAPLSAESVQTGWKILNRTQIHEIARRIDRAGNAEVDQMRTGEAHSTLEAYAFSMREIFGDPFASIVAVTTEEKRRELEERASQMIDWLDSTDTSILTFDILDAKLKNLMEEAEIIKEQASEYSLRPEVMADAKQIITSLRNDSIRLTDDEKKYGGNSTDRLVTLIDEFEKWQKEKEAEQETLKPTDPPALKVGEVRTRMTELIDIKIAIESELAERKMRKLEKIRRKLAQRTNKEREEADFEENSDTELSEEAEGTEGDVISQQETDTETQSPETTEQSQDDLGKQQESVETKPADESETTTDTEPDEANVDL
ncbi:hypothetical protein BLNAU_3511 [Blattamonas nauphoetae]|uniref:Uncharacterized protein n=1 Tax=Blattamonas nauphoetae TaxID=2049346 RepID=A0ABQ9YCA0_9EUKA|nr:hypothetical protein BLNAU_3511 [Blattamonas nauphoetae]